MLQIRAGLDYPKERLCYIAMLQKLAFPYYPSPCGPQTNRLSETFTELRWDPQLLSTAVSLQRTVEPRWFLPGENLALFIHLSSWARRKKRKWRCMCSQGYSLDISLRHRKKLLQKQILCMPSTPEEEKAGDVRRCMLKYLTSTAGMQL